MRANVPSPGPPVPLPQRTLERLLTAGFVAFALLLAAGGPVEAAEPEIQARVLLDGHARIGAWTAVDVRLRNGGAPIQGELRLAGTDAGASTYSMAVDLPTGSDKRYTLYAQPRVFRTRIDVALVVDGRAVGSASVPITNHDSYQPIVAVVAERPERIVPDIERALRSPNTEPPVVLSLDPEDLPERTEAWGAIDRLVWQDADAARLSEGQRRALETWLATGGRLAIVGGTTGTASIAGFPETILPYRPAATVLASPKDLVGLLGTVPRAAPSVPALGGTLVRGTPLAVAGTATIAAETPQGQGGTALVGIDPGLDWLAGTAAAGSLWRRLVPLNEAPSRSPLVQVDDGPIVSVLSNLPAVELPPIEQLFVLLLAYVLLIGPLNYLVLRRLDRREWAWLTMPALVLVFAGASYYLGSLIKGSDVIVNQVAIVRGGGGTTRGLGQVYVGVFSPTRQRFDVRVPGGALITGPQREGNAVEEPLDVVIGDPARLRDYQVGFGTVRAFRAETDVDAPLVESDLRYAGGRLQGTVTNRSQRRLEDVAVVYAGTAAVLRSLAPGETRGLDLPVTGDLRFGLRLSERLYGQETGPEPDVDRSRLTRRVLIDQLTGYETPAEALGRMGGPVLLGWATGPSLRVELGGQRARQVGDALFVLPLSARVASPTLYTAALLRPTVVERRAAEATDQGGAFALSRGTMTLDVRPLSSSGRFVASGLLMSLNQGEAIALQPPGELLAPLPDDEQPDQEDPLGGGPTGPAGPGAPDGAAESDGLPEVQLYDRVRGAWVEFPHFSPAQTYRIPDPRRYVDDAGSFLVRFVNRGEQAYFGMQVQLEGSTE